MAVEGSLDLFSLPEILQMISQQGKTGILTIQGQQDIVAVSFLGGRIVAADSLAHTVEEGLSKVLVSEGLIGAAEFARANAENQARGGRLLDLLVERGHLTRQQLLGALRLQTVRQLEALLHWQEGDFKFYGGDEVSFEEGFDPISVEDLLLRTLADFVGPAALPVERPLPRPQPSPAGPAAPRPPAAAWTTPAGKGAQTGAVQPRWPAGQPRPASGELWLPDVPELPVVAPPAPATRDRSTASTVRFPAAGAAAAGSVQAGAGSTQAAAVPAQAGTSPTQAAAGLAQAGTGPAKAAAGPVQAGTGSAKAAAFPLPAVGEPASSMAFAAAVPISSSSSSFPSAVPSPAPGGAPPAPAEPLPWPAAVMSPPPSSQMSGQARFTAAGAMAAAPGTGTAAGGGGALAAAKVFSPVAGFGPAGDAAAPYIPPEGAAALPRKYRQMRIDRAVDRAGGLVPRLAAAALALGLVALLAAVARAAPQNVLLPFPWEQAARDAFVRNQREALFDKVAGAAKTGFLRDGRFPDRLGQLRDSGLLSPADLRDPRGEPLLYTAHEDSYTLQATERGKPLADAEASESISGNFYLDPTLSQTGAKSGPPIVLLD